MNKPLPSFLFSAGSLFFAFFSITAIGIFLFFLLTTIAYADPLSGCAHINIGNPPGNITPPSQCDSSSSNNGGKWPFAKIPPDPATFRRVDQGWDLQGSSPQIVYAVADGTVYKANNDPSGFGDFYPYEHLDTSIKVGNNTYTDIYYGHVHYANGTHGTPHNVLQPPWNKIKAGDPIAYTYPGCCWPANWLEIGFGTSVPVGHGAFPTGPGLDMEQYLIGKRLDYTGTGGIVGK